MTQHSLVELTVLFAECSPIVLCFFWLDFFPIQYGPLTEPLRDSMISNKSNDASQRNPYIETGWHYRVADSSLLDTENTPCIGADAYYICLSLSSKSSHWHGAESWRMRCQLR
ncbi:hypothetical protein TNCV_2792581 [Trichonephila clavipes]|nr:hypothetical protein TNCV_2792581 [Trichonephila clavipes]